MNWIVFTEDQLTQLDDWNKDTIYQVRPRGVDKETHSLFGKYVVPDRVIKNLYEPYWEPKLRSFDRFVETPDNLFMPLDIGVALAADDGNPLTTERNLIDVS